MPRVKLFDKEEVIRKAMELFWEKGYESTSLTDLTEHLGIGKGSFYSTFESKEQLFHQCIERYTASNLPMLDQALSSDSDIRVALKTLLVQYVESLVQDPEYKGCFMANTCSIISPSHQLLEEKIRTHYDTIERYLKAKMERDGIDSEKAESVSAMIVTFLIGSSQQSKINRRKEGYLSTVNHIIDLLD